MPARRRRPDLTPAAAWFARRGWTPFAFQEEVWAAWTAGKSGLLHAPTGLGKTLAAWLGPVMQAAAAPEPPPGPGVLWITPLRALALDTLQSLREPLTDLAPGLEVEMRTGDSTPAQRKRLKTKPPWALVTTPESLSLLLSYPDAPERLGHVHTVIVDEWHELLASKRGVQTQLCLARLRQYRPDLRTWGLSATIGNLPEALECLLGSAAGEGVIISSPETRSVGIETLLPDEIDRFPWSGHLGLRMAPQVVHQIEKAGTTLLFTNTRSQTEIWYQALSSLRPEWGDTLAMHHGSLEREVRQEVEARLRAGTVRCVVCTSSLDLGVDFSPVDQVVQVGSPKGIARLLQRAGRSGHRPGAVSRIIGVPTNAFELVEFAAVRDAVAARRVEARPPLRHTLDVLVQHLLTLACGSGFTDPAIRQEIQGTHAFAALTDAEWSWLLAFLTTGGHALRAYPQYARVTVDDGVWRMRDERMARQHRFTIGTITADTAVSIQYQNGRRLGSVEEGFAARLKPGSRFVFAGRRLELIRCHDLTATVRDATRGTSSGQIPSWQGGRSPLSTELAAAVRVKLEQAGAGDLRDAELQCVAPILAIQKAWSRIPGPDELLIEETFTRDGSHIYVYPFAGRLVHEGIGTLVAWRMARESPCSIQVSFNDYGFELHSPSGILTDDAGWRRLLDTADLLPDLLACMNTAELARRRFREIARVAGLIVDGFPGNRKSGRALQMSSSLLFDVFCRYDPDNLLLTQAQREILEAQLEFTRLQATLAQMQQWRLLRVHTARLTPMAFPLWADMLSSSLTTENFTTRLERMLAELEAATTAPAAANRPEILSPAACPDESE